MIQELEDLTNALDSIPEKDAGGIIGHINTKLREALNPDIIDVMYKEEAKENAIILKPLSSVSAPGSRDEAIPWPITENSKGIWPRAFFEKSPVWLEGISTSRQAGGMAKNLALDSQTLPQIEPEDVDGIYAGTDSMLCLPLVSEQIAVGVFCLEFSRSEVLNHQIYRFIRRLADSYANLAWKVSTFRVNQKQTNRAVEHFKGLVSEASIREHIGATGKGIMLRPFGEESNELQEAVTREFGRQQIGLAHFIASPGRPILEDLRWELRLCPFAVVDITGLNPNVLIELGMVRILEKETMLLCHKEDTSELPFDITADQVDYYLFKDNVCHVMETGTGTPVPLADRVNGFIDKLRAKGVVQ